MRDAEINPVRKSSTFQRGGSFTPLEKVSNRASGALNPVFALKGIIPSPPLQAAGLSNGVNYPAHRQGFKTQILITKIPKSIDPDPEINSG
jgi:hypothetical protein